MHYLHLSRHIRKKASPLFAPISILAILFAGLSLIPQGALAADEFNDVQCQSDFADKDLCNLRFFKKFMSARLIKSGSNIRIPYKSVYRWSYENASLRKRSSILTTKVEHIHIFTIMYRDEITSSPETLIIDFDDIKYVPAMKAILQDILPDAAPVN